MALPSGSAQTSGGEAIATHTLASREYEVVLLADGDSGHVKGSRPWYFYNIASAVHVAAASTLFVDMFNADATAIVRVRWIEAIVNIETAVTGVGFHWQLLRTTAVGTAGTAQTAGQFDTGDAALSASVTCRLKATGGATASTSIKHFYTNSEETLAGNQLNAGNSGYNGNILPPPIQDIGIVLRQNQGIRINQETNSVAGNTAWFIMFTVE